MWMFGCGDEAEPLIKTCGAVIERSYDQKPGCGALTRVERAEQSVGQQFGAQADALLLPVDRKAGQENHPNWVVRQAADESFGGFGDAYGAHGEAVETHDPVLASAYDERPGDVPLLRFERKGTQPVIQFRMATAETR